MNYSETEFEGSQLKLVKKLKTKIKSIQQWTEAWCEFWADCELMTHVKIFFQHRCEKRCKWSSLNRWISKVCANYGDHLSPKLRSFDSGYYFNGLGDNVLLWGELSRGESALWSVVTSYGETDPPATKRTELRSDIQPRWTLAIVTSDHEQIHPGES